MKTEINGFEMNYSLEGPEGAPVVVMSHSLGADLHLWDPQIPALTGNYRVLRYDARGHGGSAAPGDAYSMEELVDDVHQLVTKLDLAPVHFIGLSMGGAVGQLFALKYPAMVRSLILCSTTSRITEPNPPEDTWDRRIEDIRRDGIEGIIEPGLERQFTTAFRNANPEVMDGIRAMIRRASSAGYRGCIHALKSVYTTHDLHEIKTPTLVVVGDEDKITPVAAAQKIHARIEGSDLLIVSPARHLLNVEQAPLFNEAVTAFLAKRAN